MISFFTTEENIGINNFTVWSEVNFYYNSYKDECCMRMFSDKLFKIFNFLENCSLINPVLNKSNCSLTFQKNE